MYAYVHNNSKYLRTFQLCAIQPAPMEEHVHLQTHVHVHQDGQVPHAVNVSFNCIISHATPHSLHVHQDIILLGLIDIEEEAHC